MRFLFIKGAALFFVLVITFACMTASFRDLTKKSFNAPEFTIDAIEAGKIAFLPTVADPSRARTIDVTLIDSMKAIHPNMSALGGTESRRLLQDNGLVDKYSQMMETYAKTAILDKSTITKMGKAVRARFLLYTRLLRYDESKLKDTLTYDLSIKAEIWDSHSGEVVWDVTGQGLIKKTMMDKEVSFEDIVTNVCDSIMQQIR
jgi:hypothetical protein